MSAVLDTYTQEAGEDVIRHLRQLAKDLQGMCIVHVNSTRSGGGVAEILHKLVPLMGELGLEARWEVIEGDAEFYQCTKAMHNALQGSRVGVTEAQLRHYEEVNAANAERLRPMLQEADMVVVHDPQPVPLLRHCPQRKGPWVWRCHIDISHPYRQVWRYLRRHVAGYDASIFSLSSFAQSLPHPQYLIPPSIDPLSDKNMELPPGELKSVYNRFAIDPDRPMILQVSRFDRFKDPLGVIQSYQLAKRFLPSLQLVLAGGSATDDPEGPTVLEEVERAAADAGDARVLLLPPDAHRIINALQRCADVVLQKSLREGFGLTVTEALWKGKPVIGGNTGGIRLQIINHHTGFLVNSPEGAALRTRYLLHNPDKLRDMGVKAREFVRRNFLLTRLLREYLTLILSMRHGEEESILLS